MRRLTMAALMTGLAVAVAPPAAAGTIEEMVQNTGALESPFWKNLYESGYGYLDAQRVSSDSKIVCGNRSLGVPPYQIISLLQQRGYTQSEAQSVVLAEMAASTSAHAIC